MSATAATATVGESTNIYEDTNAEEVRYAAAPGERNRFAATHDASGPGGERAWVLRDAGAAITPGRGCHRIDEQAVRCVSEPGEFGGVPSLDRVIVELGDLDDVSIQSLPDPRTQMFMSGGDGDDRLVGRGWVWVSGDAGDDHLSGERAVEGGPGDDELSAGATGAGLYGGPGDDTLLGSVRSDFLYGEGGRDRLFGRGGSDELTDGDRSGASGDREPGPDVLDGGPGRADLIRYARRRKPLFIDLADRRLSGERGEGDRLEGLEDVTGGRGNDVLAGNRRANTIDGGGGRDQLFGRAGSDVLRPRRNGGEVSCGRGRDAVEAQRTRAVLGGDCERFHAVRSDGDGDVDLDTRLPVHPRSARGNTLLYRLACPVPPAFDTRCTGRLRVRESTGRRRLLAAGVLRAPTRRSRRVRARLTPAGRRLAARPAGVRATTSLSFRVYGPRSLPYPVGYRVEWRTRLKLRR